MNLSTSACISSSSSDTGLSCPAFQVRYRKWLTPSSAVRQSATFPVCRLCSGSACARRWSSCGSRYKDSATSLPSADCATSSSSSAAPPRAAGGRRARSELLVAQSADGSEVALSLYLDPQLLQ